MILLASNPPKRLRFITFIGDVIPSDFDVSIQDLPGLIDDIKPGFRLVADLTYLKSMSPDCAPQISHVMDLCDQNGVEQIIRVIPDPSKDIGLTILSRFHYTHNPRMVLCRAFPEAAKHLAS